MTVTIGGLDMVSLASLSCARIALRSHERMLSTDIFCSSWVTSTPNSNAISDTVSKSNAVFIPPKILFASICFRIS